MPRATISSERFTSMLRNRGMALEQFAAELSVGVDLSALEVADQSVEFDDLVTIAKRFNHTWAYLLIDEPEVTTKGHDNRTLLNQRHPLSSQIVDQLEAAERMLVAAGDLFPDIVFEAPDRVITPDTDPARAASWIRALLAVGWDEQVRTHDDYATLRLWGSALQAHGVFVSQRKLADPTVRAFSLATDTQAVVVADTQDTPYARVFSLLHEYVHIVLRSTGVCDLSEHASIERYCNAVAAAVLMPANLLRSELPPHTFGTSVDEDEVYIDELSRRLGVSKAAFLIRLRDVGVLDQSDCDRLEARRRDRRSREEGATSGGDYYITAMNRVGRRFARGVFRALDARAIDRQDAAALLEVGEHSIRSYREYLEGRRRRR